MKRLCTMAIVVVLLEGVAVRPGAAQVAKAADDETYQIVKATEDRVWRLNKKTGEIAVCTLEGDNLVCTTSTEAITPPAKTFEQREAEKRQAEAAAAKKREEEKAKDIAFLDKVLTAIKSLIGAAIERDAPSEAPAQ